MDLDVDPDPALDQDVDPALFVSDLQDTKKKYYFFSTFLCLFLFEGTFTSFLKIKSHKEVAKNSRNQGFSSFFCLLMEGSGS